MKNALWTVGLSLPLVLSCSCGGGFTFQGWVMDAQTQEPLANARIVIGRGNQDVNHPIPTIIEDVGYSIVVYTDKKGWFRGHDKYWLNLEHFGYCISKEGYETIIDRMFLPTVVSGTRDGKLVWELKPVRKE